MNTGDAVGILINKNGDTNSNTIKKKGYYMTWTSIIIALILGGIAGSIKTRKD